MNLLENAINFFLNEIKLWPNYNDYLIKIFNYKNLMIKKGIELFKPNNINNGYNVLNHGNLHLNNILFKKSTIGTITDVLFVSNN